MQLTLQRNEVGDEGASALADVLCQTNQVLWWLDLSWNGITDEGAAALAVAVQEQVVQSDGRMDVLVARDPYMTSLGQVAGIVEGQDMKRGLRVLKLGDNSITDKGAIALACACERNGCVLECLDVESNSITDLGGMALVRSSSSTALHAIICLFSGKRLQRQCVSSCDQFIQQELTCAI